MGKVAYDVKNACEEVAQTLILEFECCFPDQVTMSTLGVMYPCFQTDTPKYAKDSFHGPLVCHKDIFMCAMKVGPKDDKKWVQVVLDVPSLDLRCNFLKMTMVVNAKVIMKEIDKELPKSIQ